MLKVRLCFRLNR